MKFRYHRGSLEDSLVTEQDFDIDKICKEMRINEKTMQMKIKYYGYDNRVDQALYTLIVDDAVIGFLYNE